MISDMSNKKKGMLIVLSGPSGTGKDTVLREVVFREGVGGWDAIVFLSGQLGVTLATV